MIPLNQKVKVIFSDIALDEWDRPVKSDRVKTYKVRLDFNSQAKIMDIDRTDVIYQANIYFKGAVPIKYDDFIEYDSGIYGLVQKNPKVIFPITDMSGKVTYTKVTV